MSSGMLKQQTWAPGSCRCQVMEVLLGKALVRGPGWSAAVAANSERLRVSGATCWFPGELRVFSELRSPETFIFPPLRPSSSTFPFHIPIHTPHTNHGSRYASSDLHHEGLAEGTLARLQERRLHGCPVLLVQEPGTAPSVPPSCSLTSSIDLATWVQTLKERFAELLPEKIEQIKALRKYACTPRPSPSGELGAVWEHR